MRKYFIAAAFAALAASPALAATQGQNLRKATTAESSYAYAYAPADTVVADGKVLGRDPDAFIRQSLLRQGDAGELAGN